MSGAETPAVNGAGGTERLAGRFAERLVPGDVVFLQGEVGSGKTTFVRGACRAIGVRQPVTSPSFTLAQRYEDGRVPVSHLDFQRLGGGPEDPGLFEEEASGERITFVEWPSEAPSGTQWRPNYVVEFEHLSPDSRAIRISEAGCP